MTIADPAQVILESDPYRLSGISQGWPLIESSLKSLLETGDVLPAARPRATVGR